MEGTLEQLLSVDPACLDEGARVAHLVSLDRLISRVSARMERTLVALADPDDEKAFAREEIRCALRWSEAYTRARCTQAKKLVQDLPEALDRHETGELNTAQARAISEACEPLDRAGCAEVLERVLPRAGRQTVTEFRNAVTRAVHRVDPRTATKKHEDDKKARDVSLRPLPNGMAGLWSVHTAIDAEAIMTRINALAAVKTPGDSRLVGARRADAMANLILGVACPEQQTQHGRRPAFTVLVPLDPVTGRSDLPAELVGYGPIPAALRRDLRRQRDRQPTAQGAMAGSPSRSVVGSGATDRGTREGVDATDGDPASAPDPTTHREDFDGTNTVEHNLRGLVLPTPPPQDRNRLQPVRTWDGTTV